MAHKPCENRLATPVESIAEKLRDAADLMVMHHDLNKDCGHKDDVIRHIADTSDLITELLRRDQISVAKAIAEILYAAGEAVDMWASPGDESFDRREEVARRRATKTLGIRKKALDGSQRRLSRRRIEMGLSPRNIMGGSEA
jgi:hypothetical protein